MNRFAKCLQGKQKGTSFVWLLVAAALSIALVIMIGSAITGVTHNLNFQDALDYILHYGATANYPGTLDVGTLNTNNLNAPTGRGATIVIAASDATATEKAQADYIWSNRASQITIQAAVSALTSGEVHFTSGTYTLYMPFQPPDNVTISGVGTSTNFFIANAANTTLSAQANAATSVLNVVSSAGFYAGDYLSLRDNAANYGSNFQIQSIVGNAITLTLPLGHTYPIASDVWQAYPPFLFDEVGVANTTLKDFKIDGNRANQEVHDRTTGMVDNEYGVKFQYGPNFTAINIFRTTYVTLDNLFITGMQGAAVNVDSWNYLLTAQSPTTSGYVWLKNSVIYDSGGEGVITSGMGNPIFITNNVINLTGTETYWSSVISGFGDNIILHDGYAYGSEISNNLLIGARRNAIKTAQTSNLRITSNTIYGSTAPKLMYGAGITINDSSTGATVTGNSVDLSMSANAPRAFEVYNCTGRSTVTGNYFKSRAGGENSTLHSPAIFIGNTVSTGAYGIVISQKIAGGASATNTGLIVSNNVVENITAKSIEQYSSNTIISGNILASNPQYQIYIVGGDGVTIEHNRIDTASVSVLRDDGATNIKVRNNVGYIASGDQQTFSGTLTAGNTNAIAFAWHNSYTQDGLVAKVTIEVTTAGGTPGSLLQVGIADNATGTNLGSEFFTAIPLNTPAVYDSYLAEDTGVQTKWILLQDSASATDGWIVGKITVQNAASLVGKYYVELVGR